MKLVVVIPALNPEGTLLTLVEELRERGFTRFLIVDDGSRWGSQPLFETLANQGCIVLHHGANRGKGAAIKTALDTLRSCFPDATGLLTVDSDGQHLPDDVLRVAQEFERHSDHIVLGTREFRERPVPLKSKMGNAFSRIYFKLDTGVSCPDTQTGLRCIPIACTGFAREVEGERYDYEMNFLTAAVKNDIPVATVPITTVYTAGNTGSHFRPLLDSALIYRSLLRFASASIICATVDLGLFALLSSTLVLDEFALVAVATIAARISSGCLNFYLNRVWSFRSDGALPVQLGRYLMLFVTQMLLSTLFVTLLAFLPIPLVVVKIVVDSMLFVISYFVQRNWVFNEAQRHRIRKMEVYE